MTENHEGRDDYTPPTLEDLEREDDEDDYDLWETR